jgi:hypothetical protein
VLQPSFGSGGAQWCISVSVDVMSCAICTSTNLASANIENESEHACTAVHYGTQPNDPTVSLTHPVLEDESENNAALHLKMLD